MKEAILQLEDLACPTCAQKIEGAIKSVEGVDEASIKVMFNASKVKSKFDEDVTSINKIKEAIEAIGYDVLKTSER